MTSGLGTVKVIVIGNCTVDLSFAVPRFPRAGETLLAHGKTVDLGGKGANQAVAASRFGAATILAAPLGRDSEGEWACRRLGEQGMSPDLLLRSDGPTDQSIIYVAPDGENCIVSTHGAAAQATPSWAEGILRRAGQRGDILLMQGNLPAGTTRAALAEARRSALTTILNPAPIHYGYEDLFPLVDIAILNEVEAAELGKRADPVAAGEAIRAGGVPEVIVTLGRDGAILIDRSARKRVAAPDVEAVDTVGAGDVLCGAFAAALARGVRHATALRIAVEAASLAVTRHGTQSSFPSAAETEAILSRHHERASPFR
jgi:ribokinase